MNIKKKLDILTRSKFRSSFHLNEFDKEIVKRKGLDVMRKHTEEILTKRIRIKPRNDGRQTPFNGYPVFTAQHATASCCRKCIEKWHHFPKDKMLDNKEIDSLVSLIIYWFRKELNEKN